MKRTVTVCAPSEINSVSRLTRPRLVNFVALLEDSGARMGDWLHAITAQPDRGASSDPARYAGLRMPALLVWGRQDRIIPLAEGERLARLLPQAKLVVLEDMNHAPHLEDTRTFNRLLLEFLGGCAR